VLTKKPINSPGTSKDSDDDVGAVSSNNPDGDVSAVSTLEMELNLSFDEVHGWLGADHNLAEEFTNE